MGSENRADQAWDFLSSWLVDIANKLQVTMKKSVKI
jgi:hypothetical protein